MKEKNYLKALLLASVLCLFVVPFTAQAMGISPVLIEAKGLLPNSSVSRKIFLTRSNPAEDEKGIVRVSGPAAKYVRLPNGGELDMPKGMYNMPYEFFIEPGTLGKGEYEAKIQVAPMVVKGSASGSGGSMILTGAQADIRFSVVTEALEAFDISNPAVHETEEGQILDFTYTLKNRGNVDTGPSKIEVAISDSHDPSFAYHETVEKSRLKIVKALAVDTDDIATKAALAVGSYVMKLKFYKGEEMIFQSRDLKFQVYPKGTLAQKGELQSFESDKAEYESGEYVLFRGVFKNTGGVGMQAGLSISLYRDDTRVEVLSTDAQFIPTGQSVTFEKNYRPAGSGDYSAVASVSFGAQKTEELQADFSVKGKIPMVYVLVSLALLVVAVFVIVLLILKKKKQQQLPPGPSAPAAAPPAASANS